MKARSIILALLLIILFDQSRAQSENFSKLQIILNDKIKKKDFTGIIKIGGQIKEKIELKNINIDTSYLIFINSNLTYAYNTYEAHEKTIELYEELKNCKICTSDKNLESYLFLIDNAINANINLEKFDSAQNLLNKAIELSKSLEESKKRIYFSIVLSGAKLQIKNGNIDSAEKIYLNLIKQVKNNNFIEKGYEAYLHSNLASLYRKTQNILKAESALFNALKILSPNKDEYWDLYSGILIQLSSIYREKGDLKSSLEFSKERLDVAKRNNKYFTNICLEYSSIASLYSEMNIIDSLDKYSNLAINSISPDAKIYSSVLHSLALAYKNLNTKKALELSRKNISLIDSEKKYLPGAVDVYITVSNIFQVKESINYNLDSSLIYYNKLIQYVNKFPDAASTENSITILTGLSNLYIEKGYDSIALSTLLKAKSLYENSKTTYIEDEQYQQILFGLTVCYKNLLDYNNASKMIDEWILIKQNLIKRDFVSLSSNFHKNKYINNDFEYYAMILIEEFNYTEDQLYTIYDNCLLLKNLELNNIRELKNEVDADISLKNLYNSYTNLVSKNIDFESSIELAKITQELFTKSKLSDKILNIKKYNSREIKNHLKKKEVSIEIGKYSALIDANNMVWSDKYYALLLFKDSSKPLLVNLCTESDIIKLFKNSYNVQYTSNDSNSLYQYLLKPLLNHINKYETIYISSCGILNKINFSAININGNSFGELYSIRNLGSTKDIFYINETSNSLKNVKKGFIYGGIEYEKNVVSDNLKSKNRNIESFKDRSGIEKWNYLEGTLKEANYISEISRSNGVKIIERTGFDATEESLSDVQLIQDSFFIHIATHGYFLMSINNKFDENPLNLSGLLFANANKNWTNNFIGSSDSSDGILTANEISNLNLKKCKLAILSACETGLGKIYGNEGIFGLQRGLKLAGVSNCIISLWKVPDSQTSELFQTFYLNIFNGDEIHNAFQKAQLYLKKKYNLPYYWAGFILLE